jgi:glycerol-3-phosphate dehydrogenase
MGAPMADLSAGEDAAVRSRPAGLPEEAIRHLVRTYGPEHGEVLRYLAGKEDMGCPVAAGTPVLRGEVVHAAREEMAVRLTDVLFRRTLLGRAAEPGEVAIQACAELMAGELGWSRDQMEQERTEVSEALRRRHARPATQMGDPWRLPS